MTTLKNEIAIDAPIEKVWGFLSEMEGLENLDPNVKKSTPLTSTKSGIGATRKVDMQDGKNWFEEKVTASQTNESLSFELTACPFPVQKLNYTFLLKKMGDQVLVQQQMNYQIKFGLFGKLLDTLLIRKLYNKGIKQFFVGLKSHAEKSN